MIPIHELKESELNNIRIACSFLFSPELAKDHEFLKNLQPASVKKAYREKAKRYHPDLHINESKEMVHRRKERFFKIQESYECLNSLFRENTSMVFDQGAGRGDIIAVGGAKGGIGKSIFAANLGVILASMGKKTILVDLDLGGANLHLYLGNIKFRGGISDFLTGSISNIQDIAVRSKYGPLLIGGDSSQLGAANITFAQKLKLLKALKQIEADYVILDLGGDTTYNIIDFFLAADYGIVLTTCDPASYLEAYNFLKVALYRKLNRIFGAESAFHGKKDQELMDLINDFTYATFHSKKKTVQDLLALIDEKQPWNLSMVKEIISTYRPYIVVNRVTDQCNVNEVVERIQLVSQKILSVNVEYIGSFPYEEKIEMSVRELVPVVAKYPQGILARKTRQIVKTVLSR
jgi:flagellar biosynthesis protein FlhG